MPSGLRETIAKNVNARALVQFKGEKNMPVRLAKESGGGPVNKLVKSTVQRILDEESSATLEQLEGLAIALDLLPYQLLLPNLDAQNPQVARGGAIGEEEVFAIASRAAREATERILTATNPPRSKKPK